MALHTGRRGRVPLSREAVLRAAVEMADEAGISSLSMRKLGERLGVEAMSLYNHIASKGDLVDGMVDVVFSEIELPPNGTGWRSVMRQRAISAREVLARHPWATGLMESRTRPGPANLRHHDAVLGILREAGLSLENATHAYSLLDSYIYGFALQEASMPFGAPGDLAEVTESMIGLDGDAYPHLSAVATELIGSGYDYAFEFEFGLDLVLDSLERLTKTA